MKIIVETADTKAVIEEHVETIYELLDLYKRCALAITYTEHSWNEAILDEADEIIRNKKEK